MSLNHRQQRQLYRIEARLRRSEPHLAGMLTVFNRLSAGQYLPAWEQVSAQEGRIGQAAAQIARAIAVLATTAIFLSTAVLALITAPFAGGRSHPLAASPEGDARDRQTGDSQNPADRA